MEEHGDRPGKRLLVVANRLPVNVSVEEQGEVELTMASGGLVSGLHSLSKMMEFHWFGWPGVDVHRNDRKEVEQRLASEFNAIPIFLSAKAAENHYNGFSNSVLWPLLHSLQFRAQFHDEWARAYRAVNEHFADVIARHVQDGDRIWIHDYHLMLLPRLLRRRLGGKKDIRIGFFLHTPFPSREIFEIVPMREEIADGLLASDLVGFHIREYVDNFLDSAADLLPTPSLQYKGKKLLVQEFPLGIDPDEYKSLQESEATQAQLRDNFQGKKIIMGVDRLDYTKGIPQKLNAFDRMLTDNPDWAGKVVMVQLCVPTRSAVDEYKALRAEVEELVGRINGKHGTLTWTPVQYLRRSLDTTTLRAFYALSDVCVVSPIRDGLNLVSYEYVACQSSCNGVLMLSRHTGAAVLLESAVAFNPWDTPRFARAMAGALDMPREERETRMKAARDQVNYWTSIRWGTSFVEALRSKEIEDE